MLIRIIGAICIFVSCGWFGFRSAANCLYEEHAFKQLSYCLDYMECELQYRLTSLPDLCQRVAQISNGVISKVFQEIVLQFEQNTYPHASACMKAAIKNVPNVPPKIRSLFCKLGNTFGHFNLEGQITEIQAVQQECSAYLKYIEKNKDIRVRSYQTLGLCIGAALAILFV